jgi:hypothetical protein
LQVEIDKGKTSNVFLKEQENELERLYPKSKRFGSFWSSYYYHSAKSLIYTVQNKQNERYVSYREIKKLMDEAPAFIKDIPSVYHLNYNNLVNVMMYLGKYNETEKLIKEQRTFIDAFHIKSPTLSKTVFLNTYESELYICYKTGNYEQGAEVTRSIEGEVKKISASIGPIYFDLLFFMAVSELMVKNYKAATRWLNKILNEERNVSLRKELQINTRLLYLIVLFELNDVLFENRLKATKRFLANEPEFKKQLKIAEAIGMLEEYASDKKNKAKIKVLENEIRKDYKTGEQLLNKHFDFSEWIAKKLEQG